MGGKHDPTMGGKVRPAIDMPDVPTVLNREVNSQEVTNWSFWPGDENIVYNAFCRGKRALLEHFGMKIR